MAKDEAISILLVEDDEIELINMKNYINSRDDVRLVNCVSSPSDAVKSIKTYLPDAIILDIELNKGQGSGLEVLENIKNMNLQFKPIIVVTTNIASKMVYRYAHENGADMVFHKLKNDYSPELVIRNILLLNGLQSKELYVQRIDAESKNNCHDKLSNRINRELDLIGISSHLVGRKYIHDSILYILEENENSENVFLYIAKKYKKGNSTIGRSIQTAIEHAWRKSSIEDLEKHYTAVVNYNTGVPTPTELIYYYVDKIKAGLKL